MKVVFMGTPAFAVPSLEALAESEHEILEVVTQPDRPRGRGRSVAPSPVAAAAQRFCLPTLKPARLRDADMADRIRGRSADAIAVVAYGEILRADLLSAPRFGCVNVHPSLLPRHRGATPIQAALLAGDDVTGVTTMHLDEGLDTGPLLLQRAVEIEAGEHAGALHDRLASLGAALLVETLTALERGAIAETPQDESRATRCGKLTKKSGSLDWADDALTLYRRVRALTPWPGASARRGERMLSIRRTRVRETMVRHDEPGRVLAIDGPGPVIACGLGSLEILDLVPAGGRLMKGADFVRGHRVEIGEIWDAGAR